MTIAAEGEFTEKVEKGSYINVSVKYGLIKLISLKIDLCEQMSQVNESCPLSGKKRITKEVEIPSEVPPVRSRGALDRSISHTDITLGYLQRFC